MNLKFNTQPVTIHYNADGDDGNIRMCTSSIIIIIINDNPTATREKPTQLLPM